jgi:hypothetical protein
MRRPGLRLLGSLLGEPTGGPVESKSNVGRVTGVFELDRGGRPCCLVGRVPWQPATLCRQLCGGRICYFERLCHHAAAGYQKRTVQDLHFPTLYAPFPGVHCLSCDRFVSAASNFWNRSDRIDPGGEREPVFLVASRGSRKPESRIGANGLVAALAVGLLTAGVEYQPGISTLFGSAVGALVAGSIWASRVPCFGDLQRR